MSNIINKLFYLVLIPCVCFAEQKAYIALVTDGPWAQNNPNEALIKREIEELNKGEFDVQFFPYQGDFTLKGVKRALSEAESNPNIDIVVTVGLLSSYAALKMNDPMKPTVLGWELSLLNSSPSQMIKSISPRIAFFRMKQELAHEIKVFLEVANIQTMAVIGDESLFSYPIIQEKIDMASKIFGFTYQIIPIISDPSTALSRLETEAPDGVMLLPTMRLSEENQNMLIDEINNLMLPSFSFMGESEVARGVLMTTTPDSEHLRLARRIALNAQDLLLMGNNEEIDPDFYRSGEIIINETTAQEIGIDLKWQVLEEAKFIQKVTSSHVRPMNLIEAAELAIENNLDLEAEEFFVKAGRQEVLERLSELLPQVRTRLLSRRIDSNSAIAMRGFEPQNLLRGQIRMDQRLYNEERFARHTIEQRLQQARIFQKDTVELDVIFDTSISYLLVLKTAADRRIAIEDINLTEANLRRAHELVDSGQARLSEVYRWESQLATTRDNLLSVNAELENIKTQFNRLLNRPLNDEVVLAPIEPNSPYLSIDFGKIEPFIATPRQFEHFKSFMVVKARETAPEIKRIDQEIMAEARNLTAKQRAFYLPNFSAFAEVSKNYALSGAGSNPLPGLSNKGPETAIGLQLTYPLFQGGLKVASRNRALYNVLRLDREREALVDRICERVIQAIDKMKASYDGIALAKTAEIAGAKNLKIVTNSYERGIVSIVDLIDAQNTAIDAKLGYVSAIYDYLIDYMEMLRSIGKFDFLQPDDERMAFFHTLESYLNGDET